MSVTVTPNDGDPWLGARGLSISQSTIAYLTGSTATRQSGQSCHWPLWPSVKWFDSTTGGNKAQPSAPAAPPRKLRRAAAS